MEIKGEETIVARKRRLCGSTLTGQEPAEKPEALVEAVM
jgi:hypothetical protein